MNKPLVLGLLAIVAAAPAAARNTQYMLPWAEVVDSPDAKAKLDPSIHLIFGEKTMPAGSERKGDDIVSRIAKGDDDTAACKAAAVKALAGLQDRAKQLGANAVVDIVSYYRNNTYASPTQYECHAGGTGGHLTFRAVFAVVPNR